MILPSARRAENAVDPVKPFPNGAGLLSGFSARR